MIYRFKLVSDEVDRFSRVIDIDADATFLDLRNAILDCVEYTKDNIDTFFLCTDDWEKEKEVAHEDTGLGDSDTDTWLMRETPISELIEDERQKLVFLFDNLSGRAFFMELKEIIAGKHLDAPACISKVGKAPRQETDIVDVEETLAKTAKNAKADELSIFDSEFEDAYGDDDLSGFESRDAADFM